ncbi:P-type DNA transfer ATPase VirB11 [Janthinobacterium violaceinigrum]|uniref:P-type DNA transfer ATPase VirB11 n=1 Tax=Janthinobacterium violaceinigrum TaxID=2654252 RepID=A0A6I1I317_9BURK|nr:P-type DNA transfer ATPase VirB11 [Janthinobacterium violaceinigrum]KAB8059161.1 P-type DNA transfer ATPase VirB11 [Janthinobacterium violaceinigrum]
MRDELGGALRHDASVQVFLEPLAEWLHDNDVTEIAVNAPGTVWVEKHSRWSSHACPEANVRLLKALGTAVATYSNQKWDASTPILSASMPDGSRIQLVMPPAVSENCYSLTLRKPSFITRKIDDFAAAGLFARIRPMQTALSGAEQRLLALLEARDYEQFLRLAVRERRNIVVAGATGSGKTTFMKGLVHEIPKEERIITIEDVRELFLPHENCVHLLYSKGGQGKSNVRPKDLLESCLRMKPDRILLAELRGDECLYYVRNAASGHPGSITSCHAGTPALAFEQLAIMIQDSPGGANLTFDVIKRLLVLTIDIVVQFENRVGERFISEIYYDPRKKLEAMQ